MYGGRDAVTGRSRFAAVVAGWSFVLLWSIAVAPGASAHAGLAASDPADGSVVAVAPPAAVLTFTEAVVPTVSTAHLVDHTGRSVVTGPARAASGDRSLELPLPALTSGTYGIVWHALAADDGHATDGTVVFSIGVADASTSLSGGETGTGSVLDIARRWSGIVALALLVGALTVSWLTRSEGRGLGPSARRAVHALRLRVVGVGTLAVLAGFGVALCDLVAEAHRVRTPGQGLGAALSFELGSTRWGTLWLARVVVLVALAATLLSLRAAVADGRRVARFIALGAALVSARIVIEAMSGHVASASPRLPALCADIAHIVAATVWLGSLLCVAVALPRTVPAPVRPEVLRAFRNPFSATMAAGVAVAVASGVYLAGVQVATPHTLATSGYGRALLIKLALLAVAGCVAAANAIRLHRGGVPGRGVAAETAAGLIAVIAVAVLVESAPATGRADAGRGATVTARAEDLVVTTTLSPAQPGPNSLIVLAASSRRPPPAPVSAVSWRGDEGRVIALRRVAPDRFLGTVTIARPSSLRGAFVLERKHSGLTVPASWSVRAPTADRSLRGPTEVAAGLVALVVLAAAFVVRRRRSAADQFAGFGDDIDQGAVAPDGDGERLADGVGDHVPLQARDGRMVVVAHADDQVAGVESGSSGRAARDHLRDA
jgi:copper transport protein